MPELPEVETVRKYLESEILNCVVTEINFYLEKSLRNSGENDIKKIINQKIISVDRIAKHLIIKFEKNYIICHLRMEGKFFVFQDEKEMNLLSSRNYDVFILKTNKNIIVFQDKRKFATVDLFENVIDYSKNDILNKLGEEPYNQNYVNFYNKLQKHKINIKSALLDQKIVSGLGNIYVDEVLFDNKIHPERKTNSITIDEAKKIIESAIKILNLAIKHGGTTARSYTSSLGVKGNFQNFLKVHLNQGKNCEKCNEEKIIKIKVSGRGTYICPNCQKK